MCFRSAIKVIEESNALLEAAGIGPTNPLSVLASLLPPGLNTHTLPMHNLQQMGLPLPQVYMQCFQINLQYIYISKFIFKALY